MNLPQPNPMMRPPTHPASRAPSLPSRALAFFFLCVLGASVANLQAANVHSRWILPIGGLPDTNTFRIVACSSNILADGTPAQTIGLPRRFTPDTNGETVMTNLQINWYQDMDHKVVFQVYDSSSTLYDLTNLWQSGFNLFVVRNYGNNTNVPSYNQLTNVLGGDVVHPNQLTDTNTATRLSATNIALTVSNSVTTNLQAQLLATNTSLLNAIVQTNSANLTITTNLNTAERAALIATNVQTVAAVNSASNQLNNVKQPASLNLTNWSTLGTNNAVFTNDARWLALNTNQFSPGSSITFTTNGNIITIASTATGGSASNAIPLLNGSGTNTTLVTANSISVTNFNARWVTNGNEVDGTNVITHLILAGDQDGGGKNITNVNYLLFSAAAGAGTIIAGQTANNINTYAAPNSAIIMGRDNAMTSPATDTVLLGGRGNKTDGYSGGVDSSPQQSVIVGGISNILRGDLPASVFSGGVILGGKSNIVADARSIAGGNQARTTNFDAMVINYGLGAFWSKTNSVVLLNTTNGVGINTNDIPGGGMNVHGNVNSDVGFTVGGSALVSLPMLNSTNTSTLTIATNLANTAQTNAQNVATNLYNAAITAIALTNTANLVTTTNLATAERNALIATNTQTLTTATNLANTAQTNAQNVATNLYNSAITAIALTNTANLVTTSNLVSNSTNGLYAILTNATVNITNQMITLSNQLAYVRATIGKDTNFFIVSGAGSASGNGTNVWSGAAGAFTNLNGVTTLTNDSVGVRIHISGIASYGSISGYPTGPWTNINGSAPAPAGYFMTNGFASSIFATISNNYGTKTILIPGLVTNGGTFSGGSFSGNILAATNTGAGIYGGNFYNLNLQSTNHVVSGAVLQFDSASAIQFGGGVIATGALTMYGNLTATTNIASGFIGGKFFGDGSGLTNVNVNITNLAASGFVTATNLFNYTPNSSWPSFASLTVTGCVAYPFINGTNAYKPWSGSKSIFVNTNIAATNVFLFYESRPVGSLGAPAWVFANRPALTNTAAAFVYEYDDNAATSLPVNDYNVFSWTADDESTYDTTAIFANTYASRTNLVEVSNGELNLIVNDMQNIILPLSVSNSVFNKALITLTVGQVHSGLTGGIGFFGVPFGEYVTNGQVGQSGFEAGKINYNATQNQKPDIRMGLDLGCYFNTDASGGSMIERMVEQPTYYGTPNNPAAGWSRAMATHWKGTWLGDLRVVDHTYNVLPPARLTIVASTNDIPMTVLTNQGTTFTAPTNIANAGHWTDNTNEFVAQRGKWFSIPQLNTTNVTLSAATTFTWAFTYPFANTNYSVASMGVSAVVAPVIGAKTTTNVTLTMTAFSGILNIIAASQ